MGIQKQNNLVQNNKDLRDKIIKAEKAKAKKKEYMRKYIREYTLRQKEKNPNEYYARKRKHVAAVRLREKKAVIEKFSKGTNRCIICGESRLACLSIDHIHGGGAKHRRDLRLKNPRNYYRWLINNGSLDDYQTLCMNCQFVKRYERREFN